MDVAAGHYTFMLGHCSMKCLNDIVLLVILEWGPVFSHKRNQFSHMK